MKPKRPRVKSLHRTPSIYLSGIVLLILGCVAYWNSFDVPFVFDDLLTIQANSGVQFGDFLRPGLFTTRPVLYLTFAINHQLHGQEPWGYHVVNFSLHILNGFLVLLIATHIFKRFGSNEELSRVLGLIAAAFFVVHPVQTESVTYISSRSELLSTFFYAIAFLLFIKRDERKIGFFWSLVVAVPFFLGLFAKETVISLPAVLLSYDFLFLSKANIRSVLRRWSFYLTYVVGGLTAIYLLTFTGVVQSLREGAERLSPWQYFITELRVVTTYVRLLIVPAGLNFSYDFRPSTSLFELPVIASFLFLLLLLMLAWHLRRRQPVASFSIVWFFVTLAPTSSFIPILDTIFEHRLYLPLIGVCLSFPLLVDYILTLLRPRLSIPAASVCAMIVGALVITTILRNEIWRDPIRLWSDSIAKSPHNPRPYIGLAQEYSKRRDYARALESAQLGLKNLEDVHARSGLQNFVGSMYLQLHQYEQAAALFREAAHDENKREAGKAYNNLGVAYVNIAGNLDQERSQIGEERFNAEKQRLLAEAALAFRKSSELDDSMLFAFDSYINVTHQIGKKDELQRDLQVQLHEKKDYRLYYGLGKLALLSGDYAVAADQLHKAIQLNAGQKLMFFNYGYTLSQLRRRDEAIQQYLQAIRLDPLFIPAHGNVALLYMQNKDFPNATANFEYVLRSDPNHISSHLNLAKIYIQMGNRSAARDHVLKVLSISPDNQEAASLWRELGS